MFCFSSNFFFLFCFFFSSFIMKTHLHTANYIYRWLERCIWLKCFIEKLSVTKSKYQRIKWMKWIPSNQSKWNTHWIAHIHTFHFMLHIHVHLFSFTPSETKDKKNWKQKKNCVWNWSICCTLSIVCLSNKRQVCANKFNKNPKKN